MVDALLIICLGIVHNPMGDFYSYCWYYVWSYCMSLEGARGRCDVVPVISDSRYGDVGVYVNVGALAVDLGGEVFVGGE